MLCFVLLGTPMSKTEISLNATLDLLLLLLFITISYIYSNFNIFLIREKVFFISLPLFLSSVGVGLFTPENKKFYLIVLNKFKVRFKSFLSFS